MIALYVILFLLGGIFVLLFSCFWKLCQIYYLIRQDKIYVLPDPKE